MPASIRATTGRKSLPDAFALTRIFPPSASFGLDEHNRLGIRHGAAPVLAVRSRQRGRELEPDYLPAHDGRRKHDFSVRKGSQRHKRPKLPHPRSVARSFVRTKRHSLTDGSGRAIARDSDAQPPSLIALNWTPGTET